MADDFVCDRCKKTIDLSETRVSGYAGGAGYGRTPEGLKICYPCCAEDDKERMNKNGIIHLYITDRGGTDVEVTNWPGSLRYKPKTVYRSKTPGGKNRVEVFFTHINNGKPEIWRGLHSGYDHQIIKCTRCRK